MILSMALLSIIGFALSWYAFYIEQKVKIDQSYKPICDISDAVSCTKVFESRYNNIFGIDNSWVGMFFYVCMFLLAIFELKLFIFYGALAACFITLFFAYLSYIKLKSYCLVCTSIYVVNVLLLIVGWMNL